MARDRTVAYDDDSDDIAPDALSLLRRDHRLAEELFAEFPRAAPQLRVHTQIEEELFYPAVSRALTQPDQALIESAQREHEQAKELIVRIESMTSENPRFGDEIAELSQLIAQHVAEEEQELFPKVSATSLDLTALGIALAERRDTLLDVLGLHGDDEEGAANQRETRPETATAVARATTERGTP
jgi:iron-sulfur cluster repair protein YtfE (RIC family)